MWSSIVRGFVLTTVLFGFFVASPAYADQLNQSQQFQVNSFYDISGASAIQSTLRAIGTRGYFYVDDRYWGSLTSFQQDQFISSLQALSQQFDSTIYPASVALWGSEANPGVDGDSHVVILLQRVISGSGGYFETIHNYSKERAPSGNAREMIFVNVESVLGGSAKTFVAHEFQHLISFNQRELLQNAPDDVWLNEARSEYNVTVVGYSIPFQASTLQRREQAFLRTPSDSLSDWPNTGADYAIASMFVHYFAGRFGESALASTIHTSQAGASAFESWLTTHTDQRFSNVFVDWMVASLLNDRSQNPAYGYTLAGLSTLHVRPLATSTLSPSSGQVSFTTSLKEWQPYWATVDVTASATTATEARIRIDGAPDVSWYGAVIATYQNGSMKGFSFSSSAGVAQASLSLRNDGSLVRTIHLVLTQGTLAPVMDRIVLQRTAVISIGLGDVEAVQIPITTPTVNPPAQNIRFTQIFDGDLIRRVGQDDIYVVWGTYRRYLTKKILELYGFQDRPVREVPDDIFFKYDASVYIRAQGAQQVYSVWPDNTKHWLDITPAQWDGSGRDWGAIFTVNDAEVAAYATGAAITR